MKICFQIERHECNRKQNVLMDAKRKRPFIDEVVQFPTGNFESSRKKAIYLIKESRVEEKALEFINEAIIEENKTNVLLQH